MDVYEPKHLAKIQPILDQLRNRVSAVAGISINGNRVTIRWTPEGTNRLVDVQMIVLSAHLPEESDSLDGRSERMEKLRKKLNAQGVELEAELYYVDHGEWPK